MRRDYWSMSPTMPADRFYVGWRRELFWILSLFSLEACVFYAELTTQITPFFPMNFDQVSYINQVYVQYTNFVNSGWESLLLLPFRFPNGTGIGLIWQGTLAAVIGGPNRTSLLTLNLVNLFGLQVILFGTVWVRTRRVDHAWIAVGILLACVSPFNIAGGMFDFRFDFCALCLFGMWICLIVWSRTFRDLKPVIAAGLVASLLISVRYVTLSYVATISIGLVLVLLWNARSPILIRRALARRRMRNCIIAFFISVALPSPLLIPSTVQFIQKYVGQHLLGTEKYMRAAEVGVYTIRQHLFFYPKSILFSHIGNTAIGLGVALLVLTIIATAMSARKASPKELRRSVTRNRYEYIGLILAIVIPVAILTADISISAVVGGIVIVPIVLGLTLFAAGLWPRSDVVALPMNSPCAQEVFGRYHIISFQALSVVRFLIVAVGVMSFLAHSTARQHYLSRLDLERINEINLVMARHVAENQLNKLQFSIDRVIDYVNPVVLPLTEFERFNRRVVVDYGLGFDDEYGLGATPRDVALRLVAASDIVVLTDPALGRKAPYPLNAAIASYWGELMDWATQNRDLLYSTTIEGIPYRVYVKRQILTTGK